MPVIEPDIYICPVCEEVIGSSEPDPRCPHEDGTDHRQCLISAVTET